MTLRIFSRAPRGRELARLRLAARPPPSSRTRSPRRSARRSSRAANVAASYDAAHADGNDVVIDGLTVTRLSSDQTLRFDKVVVDSPTEGGEGVFQSPLISFAGGTLSGEFERHDRRGDGDATRSCSTPPS